MTRDQRYDSLCRQYLDIDERIQVFLKRGKKDPWFLSDAKRIPEDGLIRGADVMNYFTWVARTQEDAPLLKIYEKLMEEESDSPQRKAFSSPRDRSDERIGGFVSGEVGQSTSRLRVMRKYYKAKRILKKLLWQILEIG